MKGFTLIELLVVIALMALLVSFSGPLVSSLNSAGSVNRSVREISSYLEQAQAYAQSNNTYVWVGFHEKPGKPSVTIMAVAGTTGAVTDISGASTRRALKRPQEFENLRIDRVDGLPAMPSAEDVMTSEISTFSHKVGADTVIFDKVIQFSPQGGVRIKPTAISRWIQIGLQPMNGNTANMDNNAAVQIAGLTGQVRVFRP